MSTETNSNPQIQPSQTPISVIANVSRVVSRSVDRVTGDRSDYPLLVACSVVEALKKHGIESRVMYGHAAWIEVLENHALQWAGCWGESLYFWVATQYGEIVDLNSSVAFKKRAHASPSQKSIHSPPILWSNEVPRFYRYVPEGVAEIELHDSKDQKKFETILFDINQKCKPELLSDDEEFPNEPIICPGRKLLDDSTGTFKMFDRTLAVTGIPDSPI